MRTNGCGCFIGLDEAGYGPNLGPLVIATSVWETPGSPDGCDFYSCLGQVIDLKASSDSSRIQVADSKQVNVGKNAFRNLERSALSLLRSTGIQPTTNHELWRVLCLGDETSANDFENSLADWERGSITIPVEADEDDIAEMADRLSNCFAEQGIVCQEFVAQIVPAARFNRLLDEHGSKGVVLSTLGVQLLQSVWDSESITPTVIVGDKHGGRNRYDGFIEGIVGDAMIFRIEEGRQMSRYRVGSTELRFQVQGERHLPVAAASIVAKYFRELAMMQFNEYWKTHVPEIRPTKGYPTDARRFLKDIQPVLTELELNLDDLWRRR
ncbi:ribonuclease H family protein [Thalassoglobus neptunius]|uniref:hypothetical protein n=1 Tax=Thalassoglobus neptunius TaxID=1938619 RepID=UPI0011B49AEF|nr:hypothetical protein [Thalassoglobus neptunius]